MWGAGGSGLPGRSPAKPGVAAEPMERQLDRRVGVEWIFRTWTLMFWVPSIASAATGWFAVGRGLLPRPAPLVLWFLTALLLQFASRPFSMIWTIGLVAQSALAIYLSVRLKLEA